MPGLFILERENLTILAVCINSNRQVWAWEKARPQTQLRFKELFVLMYPPLHTSCYPEVYTSPQVYQTHIRSIPLLTPAGLASSFWLQVSFFPYMPCSVLSTWSKCLTLHLLTSIDISICSGSKVREFRCDLSDKMYACTYVIALGKIAKLDPLLTSHPKVQTIASHNVIVWIMCH